MTAIETNASSNREMSDHARSDDDAGDDRSVESKHQHGQERKSDQDDVDRPDRRSAAPRPI